MLDAAPGICGKTFAEPREVYFADMNERPSLLMARDPANHFPYFTYAGWQRFKDPVRYQERRNHFGGSCIVAGHCSGCPFQVNVT